MLGCRCDDDVPTGRMQITCAILQYSPAALEENSTVTAPRRAVFPVTFQVSTTAQYLTCSSSKVSVQSVRWPHTRITRTSSGLGLNEQVKIDAAIWVIPACNEKGAMSPVCLEDAVRAACYPYCLAARRAGSYNSPLVLYSQENWVRRVFLLDRDCTSPSSAQQYSASVMPFSWNGLTLGQESQWLESTTATQNNNGLQGASGVIVTGETQEVQCVYSPTAVSSVPAPVQGREEFTSVLAANQPFVVAGDTALVANPSCYSSIFTAECSVSVYRMYGGDSNQMFLVTTNNNLPASRPPQVRSLSLSFQHHPLCERH